MFYFSPFQKIGYGGHLATNILQKAKINQIVAKYAAAFYTYTLKDGERADHVASNYYDDDSLSWVVYMMNDIVDPYHDWHLSSPEFDQHILAKYGSVPAAQEKIMFYRVNWTSDDRILTPAGFDALPAGAKKYWNARIGHNDAVVGYERKPVDWVVETNKTIELEIAGLTGDIATGDRIRQWDNGNLIAEAFVISILTSEDDNGNITYKVDADKVTGTFVAGGTIEDADSTFSASLVDVVVLRNAIPSDETTYWEAVSAYTYEEELNESKRTIRVLDKGFINQLEQEFRTLLAT
jgi:hypothetical protein